MVVGWGEGGIAGKGVDQIESKSQETKKIHYLEYVV